MIQATRTSAAKGLRDFWREFSHFAGRKGVVAAFLVTLGAVLEALSLALLIPLISLAIGSDLASGRIGRATASALRFFGVETPLGRLALLIGIFSALIIARAAVLSLRDVTVAALQAGFVETLRLRIAQCLVAAEWFQIVQLRHARITHLMSGDIQRIGTMTLLFLQVATSCVMLLAQCVLVLVLAPIFATVGLGLLMIGAIAFLPVVRRAHALGENMTDADLALLDSTSQFLGGLKLAISQNLETGFIDEFQQSLSELRNRQIDYFRQQSRVRVALVTMPALAAGFLVLLGFGTFHLAPATLIAIVLIITRMINPAGQIQQGVQQLVYALPAYERAKELEDELTAIPQHGLRQATALPLSEGAIEIRNVSFRHVADESGGSVRGIENISLTLKPGEIVGITGPSGAGKTTFIDILVGLFPPQQGFITVGTTALDGTVLASWRDRVSYIAQDPFLFHDTIRRNLKWANPKSSERDIWDALSLVGADVIVRGMVSGLDTIVGERGTLLSGGERQRIALARAILRRPRLLVLDEATGAIDPEGERKILEGLRQLQPRPIIVIVAHRLESLTLCERLFRFEAGHCVERV